MYAGPEQLHDWMRRRGFTQADASRYLEIDKPTLSNILAGKRSLGLSNALHVERLTGIPVEAWASTHVGESDDLDSVSVNQRRISKS